MRSIEEIADMFVRVGNCSVNCPLSDECVNHKTCGVAWREWIENNDPNPTLEDIGDTLEKFGRILQNGNVRHNH